LPRYSAQGQILGLWLTSDLNGQTAAGALPAATLLKLLEANHSMAPYFFSYNPATSKLALKWEHPFPNSNNQEMQQILTLFCKKIQDTYPLWSGTNVPPVVVTPPVVNPPIVNPPIVNPPVIQAGDVLAGT